MAECSGIVCGWAKQQAVLPKLEMAELKYLHDMPPYDKKKERKGAFFDVKTTDETTIQVNVRNASVKMKPGNTKKRRQYNSRLKWNDKRFIRIGEFEKDQQYFIIASSLDHGTKKHCVVAFEVDQVSFKLKPGPIVLLELEKETGVVYEDMMITNGNLDDKILIQTTRRILHTGTEIYLHLFDRDFSSILGRKFDFPQEDMVRSVGEIYFGDENNILVSMYTGNARRLLWSNAKHPITANGSIILRR